MHQLGYDRPLVVQYLDYLGGIVTGDFGTSIVTQRPVLQEFFTLFPATARAVALRHRSSPSLSAFRPAFSPR